MYDRWGREAHMVKLRLTEKERDDIRRLHDEDGLSYAAIAKMFNVAPITINRICNEEVAARQAEAARYNRAKYYQRDNEILRPTYVPLTFYMHPERDASIIAQFKKQTSQIGYLRKLVLADIEQEKESKE